MSEEPREIAHPLKPIRKIYGVYCPNCHKLFPLGADDVLPSVGISNFRERLRETFQEQTVICQTPNCGHKFVAALKKVYLGKPDGTLPTSETF
jgi:hypothetical protein